jgi:hypothetical protein
LSKFQDKEGHFDPRVYQAYFRNLTIDASAAVFIYLGHLAKYLQRFSKVHTRDSDVTKQRLEMESQNFEDLVASTTNSSRTMLKPVINAFKKMGLLKDCTEYNDLLEVRNDFTELIREILHVWEANNNKIKAQQESAGPVEAKKGKKKKQLAWSDIEYTQFLSKLITGAEYYKTQIDAFKATITAFKVAMLKKLNSKEFAAICDKTTEDDGVTPFVLVDVLVMKKFLKSNPGMLTDMEAIIAKRKNDTKSGEKAAKRAKKDVAVGTETAGDDDAKSDEVSGETIGSSSSYDEEDVSKDEEEEEEDDDSEDSLIIPSQVINYTEEVVQEDGNKVLIERQRSRTLRPRTKKLIKTILKNEKKLNPDDENDDNNKDDDDETVDEEDLANASEGSGEEDEDDAEDNEEDVDDLDQLATKEVEGLDLDDDDASDVDEGDEDDSEQVDSEEEAEIAENAAKIANVSAAAGSDDEDDEEEAPKKNATKKSKPPVVVAAAAQHVPTAQELGDMLD